MTHVRPFRLVPVLHRFLLLVCLGLGVVLPIAALERPLALMLLPPIGGEGSPQLAISWKGEQAGRLELSAIGADGRARVLQNRALEPGMHMDGVELAATDARVVAVLRDAQGRELARAEHAARVGMPTLDAPAAAVEGAQYASPPRAKATTLDWKPTFTGNDGPGGPGVVEAMTVYDDGSGPALVIGGAFTAVGGVVVNRIARWNGNSWSQLGSGMDDVVAALTVHNGELIAGGAFTSAGGTPAIPRGVDKECPDM